MEQELQEDPVVRLEAGITAISEEMVGLINYCPIMPGEVSIGQITNPRLRKFCVYYSQISKYCDKASGILDAEGDRGCEGICICSKCVADAEASAERHYVESVGVMFWAAVIKNLPNEGKVKAYNARENGGGLAVRGRDWQIVAMPLPRPTSVPMRVFFVDLDGVTIPMMVRR